MKTANISVHRARTILKQDNTCHGVHIMPQCNLNQSIQLTLCTTSHTVAPSTDAPHIIICTSFISSIDYNNTICAEKWRKAMIYYYYYYSHTTPYCVVFSGRSIWPCVHQTLTHRRDRELESALIWIKQASPTGHLGGGGALMCEDIVALLPAMIKHGMNLLRHHRVCQSRINSRSKFSINCQWFTARINYIFEPKCHLLVSKYTHSFNNH